VIANGVLVKLLAATQANSGYS